MCEDVTSTDGRRRRGEISRRKILAESLRLFSKHGYAGTSLSAIRDATGLPVTSLHHHFGNKAGLCLAAIQELSHSLVEGGIRERMRQVDGPANRLQVLLKGIERHHENEKNVLQFVIRLAMDAEDIDPEIRPAVHEVREQVREDLAESLALAFDGTDPRLSNSQLMMMARRIMIVMDGLLISRLTDHPSETSPWPLEGIEHMILALAANKD